MTDKIRKDDKAGKWTPGPWVSGHYDDIDDEIVIQTHEGEYVANIDCDGAYEGKIATAIDANARLIAAAPDMLEALRGLMDLNDNGGPFGGEIYQDRIDRAWNSARVAIAKATGDAQ